MVKLASVGLLNWQLSVSFTFVSLVFLDVFHYQLEFVWCSWWENKRKVGLSHTERKKNEKKRKGKRFRFLTYVNMFDWESQKL